MLQRSPRFIARAAYNNGPAIALAIVMHTLLERVVWPQDQWIRIAEQIPAAVSFTLIWYLVILVLRGLYEGWIENGIAMQPFSPIAFAWQMFQGVAFYVIVVLASLAISMRRRIAELEEQFVDSSPIERSESTILSTSRLGMGAPSYTSRKRGKHHHKSFRHSPTEGSCDVGGIHG